MPLLCKSARGTSQALVRHYCSIPFPFCFIFSSLYCPPCCRALDVSHRFICCSLNKYPLVLSCLLSLPLRHHRAHFSRESSSQLLLNHLLALQYLKHSVRHCAFDLYKKRSKLLFISSCFYPICIEAGHLFPPPQSSKKDHLSRAIVIFFDRAEGFLNLSWTREERTIQNSQTVSPSFPLF